MFELPNAKRVCREDLKSPSSPRSQSPAASDTAAYATDALRKAYSSLEIFTAPPVTSATTIGTGLEPIDEHEEEEEQEFEFRLFHSAAPSATPHGSTAKRSEGDGQAEGRERVNTRVPAVQKLRIRLRSPTPARTGEGGFLVPFRGWEYYFSDPESVMRVFSGGAQDLKPAFPGSESKNSKRQNIREQFFEVAVTSEEVLAAAQSEIWPGCHLPWRVTHLKLPSSFTTRASAPSATTTPLPTTEPSRSKKKKPGKKRRIVLRKRAAAKAATEEIEKEKRTRRNREKKIKRRQREREKKAAMRAENGENQIEARKGMSEPESDSEGSD
ncbi:hypothetical protein CPC735_051990 [Coccidioides posadasii C735 delta SOWgp]|uniref:Uncharacterized protein n=1 Tax=Coccidioides posadasii (strain C735) TaxID=222929 RepID=C5PH26_COCP7|nr:hypothetical protein CPC735_051990 [Coccidioides posadasii C735 delta SOWgp]EER23829.1 hypothetical protein CPC735_051990 [Coccidioides posadasii C735 delta SOWgp]|eukprot:XP_003065974.1 hypothetical protein CPC735_051990 [Coccidioides posadasii C735 delta SOWgp]